MITNLWLYEIFPGYSTRSLQQKRWGTSGQECLELLKKVEKPVSLFIKVRLSRLEPRLTRSRMPPHTSREVLRKVAYELEKAGKTGDAEALAQLAPEVERQFARLKAAMEKDIWGLRNTRKARKRKKIKANL